MEHKLLPEKSLAAAIIWQAFLDIPNYNSLSFLRERHGFYHRLLDYLGWDHEYMSELLQDVLEEYRYVSGFFPRRIKFSSSDLTAKINWPSEDQIMDKVARKIWNNLRNA